MRITTQQLDRFVDMAKDFARRNGLTIEIDVSGINMDYAEIFLSNGYRSKRYKIFWSEVKSLTDAGTTIFADATIFFGLNKCAYTTDKFEIKDVIFNRPATIVRWGDGTKTVVKCQEGDLYSYEVGLALCFAKKALGNTGNFNDIFKKWIPEGETDE